MIPYDDLVVALQTWRARQGLPVLALSGMWATTPAPAQASPQASFAPAPPPLEAAPTDDSLDVDGALIEEQLDPDAAEYAQNFGSDGESTSIGNLPGDEAGGTEVASPSGRRGQDW